MVTRLTGLIRANFEVVLMLFISTACLSYVFKFSDIREVAAYWFTEVGATMYLMLPMSVVLVWIIIMFMLGRLDNGMLRVLLFLEKYSTQAGLLGSVLGLTSSLHGFDFSHDTTTMIQAVVSGLLKALVSTAYGLVIAIISGSIYDRVVNNHVD